MAKFYMINYTLGAAEYTLNVETSGTAEAAAAELTSKYGAGIISIKEVNYILYGVDVNDPGHSYVWYATDSAELLRLRWEHADIVARYYTEYLD